MRKTIPVENILGAQAFTDQHNALEKERISKGVSALQKAKLGRGRKDATEQALLSVMEGNFVDFKKHNGHLLLGEARKAVCFDELLRASSLDTLGFLVDYLTAPTHKTNFFETHALMQLNRVVSAVGGYFKKLSGMGSNALYFNSFRGVQSAQDGRSIDFGGVVRVGRQNVRIFVSHKFLKSSGGNQTKNFTELLAEYKKISTFLNRQAADGVVALFFFLADGPESEKKLAQIDADKTARVDTSERAFLCSSADFPKFLSQALQALFPRRVNPSLRTVLELWEDNRLPVACAQTLGFSEIPEEERLLASATKRGWDCLTKMPTEQTPRARHRARTSKSTGKRSGFSTPKSPIVVHSARFPAVQA